MSKLWRDYYKLLAVKKYWFAEGEKKEKERIIALLQERGLKLETEVTDGDGWSHGRHEEIVFLTKLIEGDIK